MIPPIFMKSPGDTPKNYVLKRVFKWQLLWKFFSSAKFDGNYSFKFRRKFQPWNVLSCTFKLLANNACLSYFVLIYVVVLYKVNAKNVNFAELSNSYKFSRTGRTNISLFSFCMTLILLTLIFLWYTNISEYCPPMQFRKGKCMI